MSLKIDVKKEGHADCFRSHRDACLAVLNSGCKLSRKDGQFLGGQAFDDTPLSFKQLAWLQALLNRAALPSFKA